MCASVDDHIGSPELASCSIRECDLEGLGAVGWSVAEDQFSPAFLVVPQQHAVPARDHLAFTFANSAHIDAELSVHDVELKTSPEVRGDLRALNDVFAGQTSDVRAR